MYKFAENLQERIVSYIRKQIFEERTLSPGSQINEREIARSLNISRAPIREAFKELEAQGFIVSIKYKGWFVADLSYEEIMEVNTIRTLLEHSLFETAIECNSYSEADLLPAEQLNHELGEIAKEENSLNKVYCFLEKEMEFHMQLHALAKQHCLWTRKLLTNLSYQIRLSFISWLYKYGYMQHSFDIHNAMLESLKKKDLEGLQHLLSQRLDRQRSLENEERRHAQSSKRRYPASRSGGENTEHTPS